MNIHPFFMTFFELLLVSVFFIIPSFSSDVIIISSLHQLCAAFLYILVSIICILSVYVKRNFSKLFHKRHDRSWKMFLYGILTFLLLMSLSFICSLFGQGITMYAPAILKTWYGFSIIVVTTCVSAFNEELLYRFYLPDTTVTLALAVSNTLNPCIKRLVYYGPSIILFSFAHAYNGLYGIFFAALSSLLLLNLRRLYNSIILNTIVHFTYNVSALWVLSKTI